MQEINLGSPSVIDSEVLEVVALRQQAVAALEERRWLEARRQVAAERAARLEDLAVEAASGDLERLRTLLDQRVKALKDSEALAEAVEQATARAARLKDALRYQRW